MYIALGVASPFGKYPETLERTNLGRGTLPPLPPSLISRKRRNEGNYTEGISSFCQTVNGNYPVSASTEKLGNDSTSFCAVVQAHRETSKDEVRCGDQQKSQTRMTGSVLKQDQKHVKGSKERCLLGLGNMRFAACIFTG